MWTDTGRRQTPLRQGDRPGTEPSEGTNSADILISDFWPPEIRDHAFLLFKPFSRGTL